MCIAVQNIHFHTSKIFLAVEAEPSTSDMEKIPSVSQFTSSQESLTKAMVSSTSNTMTNNCLNTLQGIKFLHWQCIELHIFTRLFEVPINCYKISEFVFSNYFNDQLCIFFACRSSFNYKKGRLFYKKKNKAGHLLKSTKHESCIQCHSHSHNRVLHSIKEHVICFDKYTIQLPLVNADQ